VTNSPKIGATAFPRPAEAHGDSSALPVSNRDADWQSCVERLCAMFDRYAGEAQPVFLYMMVDGRGNAGLVNLLERVPGLSYVSLWHGTEIESYTDIAPYLIALDRWQLQDERSLQYRLARRIWREATIPMVTWLWSYNALDAMASHYRRYVTYSLPDRKEYYLHFYDNRILEHLRKVWTEVECQQFIAPCVAIDYRNRLLVDVHWENPQPSWEFETDKFCITNEQHRQLLNLFYADKLALQLRTTCGVRLDHPTVIDLYTLICGQIERAEKYRINDGPGTLDYVTCGVLVSPSFDEHPFVNERLRAVAKGEMSSVEALEGVGDDIWNAIQRKGHA